MGEDHSEKGLFQKLLRKPKKEKRTGDLEVEWLGYEKPQPEEQELTIKGFEEEPQIKILLEKILNGYIGDLLGSTIKEVVLRSDLQSSAQIPSGSKPHARFIKGGSDRVAGNGYRFTSRRGVIEFNREAMQDGFMMFENRYEFFLFNALLHEWGHSISPYGGHDNKLADRWEKIATNSVEMLPSSYVQDIDSSWGPLKYDEDFSDSVVFYLTQPEWFSRRCPRRFNFVQNYFINHSEHFLIPNIERTQREFEHIQKPPPRGII